MRNRVFNLGDEEAEGRGGVKDLLGGKGAQVAEMSNRGLPVAPCCKVATAVCTHHYANGRRYLVDIPHQIGTVIELPRAALRAGEIETTVEFLSFGKNDLTQTALGISRDDAAAFMGSYTANAILPFDPFVTLDQEAVEQLSSWPNAARKTRPGIKLGICGEHGGPASVAFYDSVGFDYVSCSPCHVPIGRLGAAQAALSAEERPRLLASACTSPEILTQIA